MLNDTPAVRSKNCRFKAYSPPNPFEFPLGDARVLITYKNTEVTATVSSHALSLCSPVWKSFLYPPWQVSGSEGEQTGSNIQHITRLKMDCREDNAEALLILFNIAHLKFSEVPLTLSTSTLYEIAILCDQYDCAEMVGPWLSGWTKDEEQESCGKESAKWMLISWVCGNTKSLRKSSSHTLRNLKLNEKGQPFLVGGQEIPRMLPHGAFEALLEQRKKSLYRLLEIPFKPFRKCWFSLHEADNPGTCKLASADSTSRLFCDLWFTRPILDGLEEYDLSPNIAQRNTLEILKTWSHDKACTMSLSIDETAKAIKEINLSMKYWHRETDGAHKMCKPQSFSPQVDAILDSIRTPVLVCHEVHTQVQAERLRNKAGPITWEPEKQK